MNPCVSGGQKAIDQKRLICHLGSYIRYSSKFRIKNIENWIVIYERSGLCLTKIRAQVRELE